MGASEGEENQYRTLEVGKEVCKHREVISNTGMRRTLN